MTDLEKLERLLETLGGEKRMNYALEHFKEALKSVGSPEKSVKSILIGGTNGKGTTTLFISQALKHHGLTVTTFLSPHLQSPTERILNQLIPIKTSQLLALAEEFKPTADKFALTYFEYLTLLFFIQAKRGNFDFAVVEVGLGGRLDCTNVTDPIATLLTNVSFDHQALLGNTLESILKEKLGTLRKESLLFTGVTEPALRGILEKKCEELDAVFYYSSEIRTEKRSVTVDGQEVLLNGYPFYLNNPSPGTVLNASLAFLMLRIVFPIIPISTLQEAFRKTKTPGRFEVIHPNPRVILSGDHNPAGIECLKETLKEVKNQGKLLTLCAFSPDKPYLEMYQELSHLSDRILLTQVPRLKDKTSDAYKAMGEFEPEAHLAVEKLLAEMRPNDTLLITGSLYLVGELRKIWKERVEF